MAASWESEVTTPDRPIHRRDDRHLRLARETTAAEVWTDVVILRKGTADEAHVANSTTPSW